MRNHNLKSQRFKHQIHYVVRTDLQVMLIDNECHLAGDSTDKVFVFRKSDNS